MFPGSEGRMHWIDSQLYLFFEILNSSYYPSAYNRRAWAPWRRDNGKISSPSMEAFGCLTTLFDPSVSDSPLPLLLVWISWCCFFKTSSRFPNHWPLQWQWYSSMSLEQPCLCVVASQALLFWQECRFSHPNEMHACVIGSQNYTVMWINLFC